MIVGYDTPITWTVGDDENVPVSIPNVPTGQSVTKAWFTVKTDLAVVDASAVFQKTITRTAAPGVGQIVNDGSVGGTAKLNFEVTQTDTLTLVPGRDTYYDVQFLTSAGKLVTIQRGQIIAVPQTTLATS